jgi:hypothetical protein
MSIRRFEAKREHGSDWQVVDNLHNERPIATGLDRDEAENLADQRNSEHEIAAKNNA